MKRLSAILLIGILCASILPTLAVDAVSSATINVTELPELTENPDSAILVVYFSTNDTVKSVAYVAADALGANVFEIIPAVPYTEADLNYYSNSARSIKEQYDKSARPEIASLPEDLTQYDTILLGFPIWAGQAPKILYTFLESIDLSGKTMIPFFTSGSSPVGSSVRNLQALTGETTVWLDVKRIDSKSTSEDICIWALSLNLKEEYE